MKKIEFYIEKIGDNEFSLNYKNKTFKRSFTSFFYRNLEKLEELEKNLNVEENLKKYNDTLELIGEEIRFFLIPDEIKEEIEKIFREANKNDEKVVLKINSDNPEIHDFPFELIRFNDEYLLKKPNYFLVRDVPSVSDLKRVSEEAKEKLKILVILSLPLDEYENAPLDLLEEIKTIYSELEPEIKNGNVEVYIEDRANINAIYKILENESFDIVHFTGHGAEGGYLLFEDEQDFKKGKLISIKEFRNMFISKQPDLFFLDACLTGKSGYDKPSLAFQLYKEFQNSHIVANLTSVFDRQATEGAKYFYRNLVEKKSLAELLAENRRRLTTDWWKGVIFTSKPEYVLFNVVEKEDKALEEKVLKIDDIDRTIDSYVYRYEIIRNVSQKLEDKNIKYLAFYGIGGVGKTYLMKYFSWFYHGRFNNILYFDLKEESIDNPLDLMLEIANVLYEVDKVSDDLLDELEDLKESNERRFVRKWFKEIPKILKGKTLLILDNLEGIAQEKEGLLKNNWKDFIDKWVKEAEKILFLATRVKIFKTQREEFENFILVDEFNKNDFRNFIFKLSKDNKELENNLNYINQHLKEIEEFLGYHPLAIRLLIQNKPTNILDILDFKEIKVLFDFYKQYLDEFKSDFKVLLLLHNKFSKELIEKLGIDINLIHLLKNKIFVLKEDGEFLTISKIFRSYFRKDEDFKLNEAEAKKVWEKLKPLLDNPQIVNQNKEAVLLLLMEVLESLRLEEIENKFFDLLERGNLEEAFIYFIETNRKLFEIENTLNKNKLAEFYFNLGNLYSDKGELDKAEEYYLKALEIYEKILPTNHPDLAFSYNNLGNLYSDKGEYDKAEEYYLKALEIFEKTLPINHSNLASSYLNLGNLYSDKGELDKAEEYYLKALEIYEKILPTNHSNLATSYLNLGVLYAEKGELDKTENYFLKALEIYEKILPTNHPDLASLYNNLGNLYRLKGELDKAEKYYLKALEIFEKTLPTNHSNLATSYLNLGALYHQIRILA